MESYGGISTTRLTSILRRHKLVLKMNALMMACHLTTDSNALQIIMLLCEHKFYDFGYDNYGCLKCQVFDTDLSILKTMVQTDAYFASDFRDINSQDDRVSSNKDIILSNVDIIKYKCLSEALFLDLN